MLKAFLCGVREEEGGFLGILCYKIFASLVAFVTMFFSFRVKFGTAGLLISPCSLRHERSLMPSLALTKNKQTVPDPDRILIQKLTVVK